jgi:DNA adenine methylase
MPRVPVQEHLFGGPPLDAVINVASVPKLSPFRYPGGKTWLVPRIRQWLRKKRPAEFIEPFAGGGIVSLTVANESLAAHVVMCELDCDVAAVWSEILLGDPEALAMRILQFRISAESVRDQLARTAKCPSDAAFQTILKNRTYHGGILAPGSAPLKYGENGKGIASRWYPETLASRIRLIAGLRDRIQFVHGDGFELIRSKALDAEATLFIDPPYTAGGKNAGKRLYKHYDMNHDELFSICAKFKGDVLMTYDDAGEVRALAAKYGFLTRLVSMKNTHHAEMQELLVGKDFSWLPEE